MSQRPRTTLDSDEKQDLIKDHFKPFTDLIAFPPKRRVEREKWVPRGRSLHLIDIENLMGGPFEGTAALKAALSTYLRAVGPGELDLYLIACNPALAFTAKVALPGAQLLMRGGPNGADFALIDWASDVLWLAARHDRIVIGSGDGIFETVAYAYRALGLEVDVVAREGSISRRLATSSTRVTQIANP